ncbi:MAG: hypothetical protein AB7S26_30210 [Sandaracinaceae bacterium]
MARTERSETGEHEGASPRARDGRAERAQETARSLRRREAATQAERWLRSAPSAFLRMFDLNTGERDR